MNALDLDVIIIDLLNSKPTVNLREIAAAAGLSAISDTNRRAIQRALLKLTSDDVIEAHANARARYYTLKGRDAVKPAIKSSVGYKREFLLNYIPNQSHYLNSEIRNELLATGQVENIVRPAGTYARQIFNRLLIDLSWNSSRLEGNTYTLLETKRLIEFGESAAGKDAAEAQMILNHKDAIEYIIESADEKKITAHEILSIHALLSNNLLGNSASSGRIREIAVGISGTIYQPLDNQHQLKEYFEIFVDKLNHIQNPFEQSFFSLVHLSYLQTFEDVNKRTSRLVSNIPFIKRNLTPLSFIDVNQSEYVKSLIDIYERNDVSKLIKLYVSAYKISVERYSAAQQSMGEQNIFKLKYRNEIQKIIHDIIINKISDDKLVGNIRQSIRSLHLPEKDEEKLFQLIEAEIINLHENNIARFKVRPSEFAAWKRK